MSKIKRDFFLKRTNAREFTLCPICCGSVYDIRCYKCLKCGYISENLVCANDFYDIDTDDGIFINGNTGEITCTDIECESKFGKYKKDFSEINEVRYLQNILYEVSGGGLELTGTVFSVLEFACNLHNEKPVDNLIVGCKESFSNLINCIQKDSDSDEMDTQLIETIECLINLCTYIKGYGDFK